MKLLEFFDSHEARYEDPSVDNSIKRYHDTRKSKLTLMHINCLRRMNDARELEEQERIKDIQRQFKPSQFGGGLM